jgi:hypothetical protein
MQRSICSTSLQQRIDAALQPLAPDHKAPASLSLAQAIAAAHDSMRLPADMHALQRRISRALQPLASEQETLASQNATPARTGGTSTQISFAKENNAVPAT